MDNADCDGWVMSAVWRMVVFQKTSSTVSWYWGKRTTGHHHLRFKNVCVRHMKAVDIDTMSWEGLATDRTKWRSALKQHLKTGETKWWLQQRISEHAERRTAAPSDPKPHDVISAIKTAIPTLVFSDISAAATTQQQINKIKNKKQTFRMAHRRMPL